MKRSVGLCSLILLLAVPVGAAPKKKEPKAEGPPPPPAIGVTVMPVAGARRTDGVLPGHLLAVALPRGADGRRALVALASPDDPKAAGLPKGPRSLYLIDLERAGAPRRLLEGLPAEADALAAADLDSDGSEEILLGAPGIVWSLGTAEAPTAPRLLLEEPGIRLQWSHASENPPSFQMATVGRLRTWTAGNGRLVPGPEQSLPVKATRDRRSLRLTSLPVTAIRRQDGPPVLVAGPEASGKLRLSTLLLASDGPHTEAWAQLPGPEEVASFHYLLLDGKPVLVVTTTDAEKLGIFANQRFRLFPLTADRSRSGQPPTLAFQTASHRWFPVDPVVADLDGDGKEDLIVLQPEGLGGGDLMIDTFFGQGNGRFERPIRLKLNDLEGRAWRYGHDLTGDGVADLAVVTKDGLQVFPGTPDPRRALLDRKSRRSVELVSQPTITVTVGAGTDGVETSSTRTASLGSPQVEDLDGDGRPEVLLFSANDNGRGRVTVVRLGG